MSAPTSATAPGIIGNLTAQTGDGLGQTIRDAVEEATREAMQEVRAAQQQVRDAQQQVRDAQQGVRDAQQQLRDARSADQRGAANQSLSGAQDKLREAEAELRRLEAQFRSNRQVYTTQPPDMEVPRIPGEAVDLAIGFFITCAVIVIGWPISRALGRRLERRGAVTLPDAGVAEQLQRIEQGVEAMAIEVERISEAQRYLAKLRGPSPSAIE
jgi:multidrug efflux pump subunit AcrA (membrane-fusion protein)